MPTDKRVTTLIVNTLTEEQYQELENPSDTEMWVTPYDKSILPSQTGQAGKFLTTDGTNASWGSIPTVDQTYNSASTNAQSGTAVASAISTKQDISNLVTSVSSASTDSQYPSAKLFYDTCGDIETLINAL